MREYTIKVHEMSPQISYWKVMANSEEEALQGYKDGVADWLTTNADYPDCEEIDIEVYESENENG